MNSMPLALDIALSLLVVIGAFFALVGSYGLIKLSDLLKRLHGPTKATTLGVGSVLVASALFFTYEDRSLSLHEILVALFLFLTAPVSAHLLVKAAKQLDPTLAPPRPDSGREKGQ
jgi:multicomponent K+:H+ antiporter subunit G